MGYKTHTLTVKHDGLSRDLRTEVLVVKAFNPATSTPPKTAPTFMALWDTGATGTVISKKVVKACGLKPISITKVNTASHKQIDSNVYLIGLLLPSKIGFPSLRVTEGNLAGGIDVLIGMDIIATGDFAVTNKDRKTVFSFRHPSIECIDFLETSNQPKHIGRNSPCSCGSGKKYKRCCGK